MTKKKAYRTKYSQAKVVRDNPPKEPKIQPPVPVPRVNLQVVADLNRRYDKIERLISMAESFLKIFPAQ